ncbi:MAG TPA: ABC transporter permease [Solirubrobacterales bacterium]|nr:ABC transporter permease [Solirubrobacterales bacterium]
MSGFAGHPLLAGFGGAFEFIFHRQSSNVTEHKVGGLHQVLELALTQIEVSIVALAIATIVAVPIGLYLGHKGVGEGLALALGNASRAVPELAAIALIAAVVGVGFETLAIVLAVLGIPPILTNTFTGIRQVDRSTVEAARGTGMTEFEVLRKVEVPMAVAGLMGGIRTSSINIIATATIAPLAGVLTLGAFIIDEGVYGANGALAGSIVVVIIALIFEFALAGLQRQLTSKGLRLQAQ